jgi:SAM-dependent methyltransferase
MSPARDPAHFEALYAASPDPWNFETSSYEAEKYAATLAALRTRRFASGFEVGCSIGVLTARLATVCDALLAVDIVPRALAAARLRNQDAHHVTFQQRTIPDQWPGQTFDLIILSEVLYFLDAAEIARTADLAHASLAPGGLVLLVNYRGPIDEPLDGEAAAQLFTARFGASEHVLQRAPGFRLDCLS